MDPRDVRRIALPLTEVLFLVVCATVPNCNEYDHSAAWCDAHLDFLRLSYEDAALDHRQTVGPERQAQYNDVAIQTTLMVRTAFKPACRQTEGLMAPVITVMELTISAPDHSTIRRRARGLAVIRVDTAAHGPLHILLDSTGLKVYGAGQWLEAKHDAKSRQKWRKLQSTLKTG